MLKGNLGIAVTVGGRGYHLLIRELHAGIGFNFALHLTYL